MVLASVACSVCCMCLVGRLKDVCSRSVMIWHVCVCVCVWPSSLAVPLAAHHGVLLIC